MLDEGEFLGPHGIRSISRYHADHPFVLNVDGPGGRTCSASAKSQEK